MSDASNGNEMLIISSYGQCFPDISGLIEHVSLITRWIFDYNERNSAVVIGELKFLKETFIETDENKFMVGKNVFATVFPRKKHLDCCLSPK